MDKEILHEIRKIWNEIENVKNILSKFYDSKHDVSTQGIKDNSEGIFDVAEVAGQNSEAMFDLADMVANMEERVGVLEEAQNNG